MNKQHLGDNTKSASGENGLNPVTLRFALQSAARELIPQERIRACFRYHLPDQDKVNVHHHKTAKKAYFSGLMVCGSIWHCPVCAHRVSEERRKELHRALMNWTGGMAMITYTASHHIGTPATEMIDAITDGVRRFKSGQAFMDEREKYGWIGSAKALEITYGDNGWHPHVHELVFFNSQLGEEALDSLEFGLRIRWRDILGARGYLASTDRGLVMQTADTELADYVLKWGHEPSIDNPNFKNRWSLDKEMTKSAVKKGKKNGRTPTQLLLDYMIDDFQAGELWREYAYAIKGKRQLVWSRGMRKLLKLGIEKSDEEIAAEIPPQTVVYATFSKEQWRQILHHDLRGEILYRAGYMTQDDFSQWMVSIIDGWK